MTSSLVYAVTPYVDGVCMGVGVFDNEEIARSAQAALTEFVNEQHGNVEWTDHGWVTIEQAEAIAVGEVLSDLLGAFDDDDYLS